MLYEKEKDAYYKGEVTDELVTAVQNELGVVLPDAYLQLMRERNGFALKKKYFPTSVPNSWANNSVCVDHLLGLGAEPGLLDNDYLRREWGIRSKKVIILSAEPPLFICLDYRRKKQPAVVFIDVDEKKEILLAPDFASFIDGLQDEIEERPETEDTLSQEQISEFYLKIDQMIEKGKPGEIDRLFTKVLSTNHELIRYMVRKMKVHALSKVHFNLLLFLVCCSQGDNKGIIEDGELREMLDEFSLSKNRDVRDMALYSLNEMKKRV
ncbi:SMI1/KNR4 family protein [Fictibacillus iocasae]|uniref:SMI1/KNR4 family protein n=1 Tax=Fictibacillus iocasae TaxID=2715437 RepID=A0ABW2NRV1_9BACL